MRRVVDATARYQAEHLELRPGQPMSQNNAIQPLSRQTSQTSGIAENVLEARALEPSNLSVDDESQTVHHSVVQPARVHDHNRPFPPPRLPTVHVTASQSSVHSSSTLSASPATTQTSPANPRSLVTAPLSPLSSTFRTRPRAAEASETSPRGFVANDTPPRSPIGEVSLTVPRPDGERTINEYVEAPFKHCWNQDRRLDEEKRGGDCPKIDRPQAPTPEGLRRRGHAPSSARGEDSAGVPGRRERRRDERRRVDGEQWFRERGDEATGFVHQGTNEQSRVEDLRPGWSLHHVQFLW